MRCTVIRELRHSLLNNFPYALRLLRWSEWECSCSLVESMRFFKPISHLKLYSKAHCVMGIIVLMFLGWGEAFQINLSLQCHLLMTVGADSSGYSCATCHPWSSWNKAILSITCSHYLLPHVPSLLSQKGLNLNR